MESIDITRAKLAHHILAAYMLPQNTPHYKVTFRQDERWQEEFCISETFAARGTRKRAFSLRTLALRRRDRQGYAVFSAA